MLTKDLKKDDKFSLSKGSILNINPQSFNGKRQALFCYELCKQLAASVLGRLFRLSALHITVDHRQLLIIWEHWSAKKT